MPIKFADIEKVDCGAQFLNADLHVHSFGGSHDVKDQTMTVEAIVDEAVNLGIGILAITDHNSDANTKKSIDYAQRYAGQLLVLAGVEVSTSQGHLLVYAAPERAASIRNLLAKVNLVGEPGDQEAHTAMSMADVIREAEHLGCVSIAAHIDRAKSGFEMFTPGYQNWKKDVLLSPGLYGLEFDDAARLIWYSENDEPNDDGANRRKLFAARAAAPATMGRHEFARVQGSDAHSLKAFSAGRAGKMLTRFKLNELTFEAFRVALADPEARVRALATIPRSLPRVLGMHVSGGFLDGEAYRFSSNLNCFIGGRGTGKSSALKTLAYGLGVDDELDGHGNGPGTVVVYCEDENGTRYRYERVQGGMPIVKAKDDGAPIVDVPVDAFRVEYYRQGELAEVADNPLKNPALFQDFLDRHLTLTDLQGKEIQLVTALAQNSAEVIPLEGNAAQLPEKNRLLGEVNKKLQIAEEGKLKDIAAEQAQLVGERSLAASLSEVKDRYKAGVSLADMKRDYAAMEAISKPITASADSAAALSKIKEAIDRANGVLDAKRAEINAELAKESSAIAAALAELKAAQAATADRLNLKVTDLQRKGLAGNIAELNVLLKQKAVYASEITRINGQAAQLKQLRIDRQGYLLALANVREEIATRRKDQLASINANLSKTIEDYLVFVRYEPSGIIDEYRAFILHAMQGTHFREDAATVLCTRVAPPHLAELVRNQDGAGLAAVGGVDAGWAAELCKRLSLYKHLHALQTMWKPPCPVITVKTKGPVPKSIPVHQLSDGQKHTIMLTIAMLAESNIPLVIDQPEDDLDNAFIFSAVVRVLRAIKERRQVVLVTHNANIAVLGDAELLLPMQRAGDGGKSFDRGSVDRAETKAAVLKILEGGDLAFRRRKEIYGH